MKTTKTKKKNTKEKSKPKFKVGDFITFGKELCVITKVGTGFYYLSWLTDTIFWDQASKDRAAISVLDEAATLLE